MKSLYESILDDIDVSLEKGDVYVANREKLKKLISLMTDEQSAHFTCYSIMMWNDYERGFTPHTFLKKFANGYNSGIEEYKANGQPAWEELFEIAKKELKRVTLADIMKQRHKPGDKCYLVIRRSKSNNEYKGGMPYLEFELISSNYVYNRNKRLSWEALKPNFGNSSKPVQFYRTIGRIKDELWENSNWDTFVFDVNSNPAWSGIYEELCRINNMSARRTI